MQVLSEGSAPVCLLALVDEGRSHHAAQHILKTLAGAVQHALKHRMSGVAAADAATQNGTSWRSPLHTAFQDIDRTFSKLHSPREASVFPTTSVTAVLLDGSNNTVYSLWYGKGAQPCWVTDADGVVAPPTHKHAEHSHRTTVREEIRSGVEGQLMFMLGNPGMWCATYELPAARLPLGRSNRGLLLFRSCHTKVGNVRLLPPDYCEIAR